MCGPLCRTYSGLSFSHCSCSLYCCIYIFSDVLKVGVWSQIPTLKDLELRRLAESLPQAVLGYTAASTMTSYSSAWRRWKEWVGSKDGAAVIPAQPMVVALYFRHLMEQADLKHNSFAVISNAAYGIQWAHTIAGLPSPLSHPIVKAATIRRVASCKPGKPGLTSFSETLALSFIQFLSFRKMKVQDRQNAPSGLQGKTGWPRA